VRNRGLTDRKWYLADGATRSEVSDEQSGWWGVSKEMRVTQKRNVPLFMDEQVTCESDV